MKKPMPRINMEKHRRAIPFRTFLSRLIWITVIPLVGLAVYLAVNDVYTLQAQLDQSTADRVHNVVSVIDRQIEAQIAGLEVLAASPLLDDTSRWNEFYREAVGYKENFGGHVVLADPSMKMILNTRLPFGESLPPLPRPGGHAAAPAVLETGNPSVGDMFLGPIAREPLVAVVVPVRREGQIRFLLLSLIETRRFEQRLQQLALPSAWSVTLLDGKKEIMTRRSPPGLEYKPDDSALNKRFTAKSALSQWSVVLEVPKEVYHAPVFTAGLALGIIIFVGTLAGVVGGRLVGRRLAQAVAGLSDIPPLSSGGLGIAEIETVRAALNEASEARRASEQSLQDAHRRLRSFVDANIVGVLVASPSGRVIETNDYYLRMIGYTREEFELGMVDWRALTPIEWLPADEQAIKELRERGVCTPYEKQYVRRDGTRVTVYLADAMLSGPEEQIAAFALDITERKRAEEELLKKINELERFHKVTIDREHKMIGLKKEINALLKTSGQQEKYIVTE